MTTHDAISLDHGLSNATLVLRITDDTSVSPLTPIGFTATSTRFRPAPSNTAWKRFHQPLRGNTSWTRDPSKLQQLVDHVTGGWKGYTPGRGRNNVEADADNGDIIGSDWISTSVDLEWCLFEISRRLTVLPRYKVQLSVITRRKKYSRRYKGTKMIHYDPAPLVMKLKADETNEKKRQDALNFVRAS
ncbi:hypothetical protein I317_04128 [Kwoniella heveanensis CBS 569]|nr:hypothetical protein I317_04128 [Kwoniella heveanensis CBS 569]